MSKEIGARGTNFESPRGTFVSMILLENLLGLLEKLKVFVFLYFIVFICFCFLAAKLQIDDVLLAIIHKIVQHANARRQLVRLFVVEHHTIDNITNRDVLSLQWSANLTARIILPNQRSKVVHDNRIIIHLTTRLNTLGHLLHNLHTSLTHQLLWSIMVHLRNLIGRPIQLVTIIHRPAQRPTISELEALHC